MWRIKESKRAVRKLEKAPRRILLEYEVWKKVIELSGPDAVKKIFGFKDHALRGEWKGARSSYLNKQWRIIYFVKKKDIQVFVLEVNAHDYRKKS